MNDAVKSIDDLNQEQTARLVMDVMHRTIIHYALWFTEIRHQMGMEMALEALFSACDCRSETAVDLSRAGRYLSDYRLALGIEFAQEQAGQLGTIIRAAFPGIDDDLLGEVLNATARQPETGNG